MCPPPDQRGNNRRPGSGARRSAGGRGVQRAPIRRWAGRAVRRGRVDGEGCRMPPRPVVQQGQSLRVWQRKALMEYLRGKREDFLAVATPGAGKTTFALRVASELFADGTIDNLTVVTPTEHLKTQWAQAAARVGIDLDAGFRNSDVHAAADFHGTVVTYAQVGIAPAVHKRRTLTRRTLVVLDEIHHAGDSKSWGDGVKSAFEPAVRRVMLPGTPLRGGGKPIPFFPDERGGGRAPRSPSGRPPGDTRAPRD